jgi:hypothetical protein
MSLPAASAQICGGVLDPTAKNGISNQNTGYFPKPAPPRGADCARDSSGMKTQSVFIVAESPTPRSGDAPKKRKYKAKPAGGRVCQSPFSGPAARSKCRFGYAGAERMGNPLAGAYANRHFRTRRHGANAALGMPARSVSGCVKSHCRFHI